MSIGYVSVLLEDAKVYANHAKKKCVDTEDVKLAVMMQLERSFQPPPPREVSDDFNETVHFIQHTSCQSLTIPIVLQYS